MRFWAMLFFLFIKRIDEEKKIHRAQVERSALRQISKKKREQASSKNSRVQEKWLCRTIHFTLCLKLVECVYFDRGLSGITLQMDQKWMKEKKRKIPFNFVAFSIKSVFSCVFGTPILFQIVYDRRFSEMERMTRPQDEKKMKQFVAQIIHAHKIKSFKCSKKLMGFRL